MSNLDMCYARCAYCNEKPPEDDSWSGLCPSCREALEIGLSVLKMKEGQTLFRSKTASYHNGAWLLANISPCDISGIVFGEGATPLEALRGAKGEVK